MRARPTSALAVVGVLLAMATWSAAAGAEVTAPTAGGPDESIAQAYGPLKGGVSYSGAFDDSSYDDVDYLAFHVSKAGQTLEFTIANTTPSCSDPNDTGCPVYGTLMDGSDHQVGGDTSAAGTIATAGDTETFDWTFSQPGTYYLLMENNGDLPAGNPTYTARFVSRAGGTGTAPLVKSLKVPTPLTTVTVTVPPRTPRPGLAPIDMLIRSVLSEVTTWLV